MHELGVSVILESRKLPHFHRRIERKHFRWYVCLAGRRYKYSHFNEYIDGHLSKIENFRKNHHDRLLYGSLLLRGTQCVSVGITSVILKNKGWGRVRNHLNGMSAEVVLFERMLEILSYKFYLNLFLFNHRHLNKRLTVEHLFIPMYEIRKFTKVVWQVSIIVKPTAQKGQLWLAFLRGWREIGCDAPNFLYA